MMSECQICARWREFITAMANVDPQWATSPVPEHPCIDKARDN